MPGFLLALDFGGTQLSAGVAERGATVWHGHRRVLSASRAGFAYERAAMWALARELLAGQRPAAIGVSFGGPADFAAGRVRLSHHVPGWEDIPLRQLVETEFGAPAAIDNDANVAALGEHRYGAGRGYAHLMYVTVSTGVGGGWILNGQPWRGAEGLAGEIGHTVADPAGPVCLCGKRGCVERLASGPYMAEQARAALRAQPERGAILRRLVDQQLDAIDGRRLAAAAAQGDDVAGEVLDAGARALGVGIGNAANLVNPQRFILGGGVTKAGERWWTAVRQAARATALPEVNFEIVPAELGDDAPLWGAVALAENALRFQP